MYRLIFPLALVALAGCQSSEGPLGLRKPSRAPDPMLSIEQQKAIGREKLSLVEDDRLLPKAYVDRPGTTGR
ncbi:MAG: hypothetical protein U0746_15660 [Gemmataceae bacterium]